MKKNWKLFIAPALLLAVVVVIWAQQPVSQGPQAGTAAAWLSNTSQVGGNATAVGNGTTSTGTQRVTISSDSTGQVALAAGSAAIGSVTILPSTSSTQAYTRYHNASAAAGSIKASAGNLYGLVLGNDGTIPCYMQLFNTAGTPTAGTSVVDSFMVQAGVTIVIHPGPIALENFATGIGYAGATADGGATTTGCTTTFNITALYQ